MFNNQLSENKIPYFMSFSNFHGVNSPTTVDTNVMSLSRAGKGCIHVCDLL